jgi:hypothetical protein
VQLREWVLNGVVGPVFRVQACELLASVTVNPTFQPTPQGARLYAALRAEVDTAAAMVNEPSRTLLAGKKTLCVRDAWRGKPCKSRAELTDGNQNTARGDGSPHAAKPTRTHTHQHKRTHVNESTR